MQREARITSKGQITVPKAVRHALGLKPGDKVVFEQEGEEICVRPVRAQSMFARYRGIDEQTEYLAGRLRLRVSRGRRTVFEGESPLAGLERGAPGARLSDPPRGEQRR